MFTMYFRNKCTFCLQILLADECPSAYGHWDSFLRLRPQTLQRNRARKWGDFCTNRVRKWGGSCTSNTTGALGQKTSFKTLEEGEEQVTSLPVTGTAQESIKVLADDRWKTWSGKWTNLIEAPHCPGRSPWEKGILSSVWFEKRAAGAWPSSHCWNPTARQKSRSTTLNINSLETAGMQEIGEREEASSWFRWRSFKGEKQEWRLNQCPLSHNKSAVFSLCYDLFTCWSHQFEKQSKPGFELTWSAFACTKKTICQIILPLLYLSLSLISQLSLMLEFHHDETQKTQPKPKIFLPCEDWAFRCINLCIDIIYYHYINVIFQFHCSSVARMVNAYRGTL